jgi:ferredoxin-NADP reductase
MGCAGAGCGSKQPAQFYPALMSLPDLPPERRAEIERQAHARMIEGITQMNAAMSGVAGAVERQDFTKLQDATERMHTAIGQFESGLAAHQALAEGQAPRNVALRWFKREMNLTDPIATPQPRGVFGQSDLHYFAMALLAAFAVFVSWIYIARTRRTTALLASLQTGETVPAPATAPVRNEQPRVPPSTTGNWAGKLRVARIFQETPTVKTFRLAPLEGAGPLPFMFEPGQFLTVAVSIGDERVKRSYSIASSPCCHGWCEITVKHESGGIVSGYLHERAKEGDSLDVSGPYGRFTFRGVEAPGVVFIAGGVGVTPLMSSIRYLTDQSWNGRIDLIYACARLDAVIFREELDYLVQRHPNLHVTIVLSDESSDAWSGPRGFITSELLGRVPDIRSRRIHLCGPPAMMDATQQALAHLGVAEDAIHTELFLSATKPLPTPAAPIAVAAVTCSFARSNRSAPMNGKSVLETAESIDVPIEYACRQGYCGVCKVKLVAGDVTMAVRDGLTPADQASGLILACQAKATADIAVDV